MHYTASQVLNTFRFDVISLFFGAAFATTGILSLGVLLARRRFEALLFWLALFAILYGGRLWMQTGIVSLLASPSPYFVRFQAATNFLVPVPAFFFFQATGFLGRLGDYIAYTATLLQSILVVGALSGVSLPHLYFANNVIVIAALVLLLFQSFRTVSPARDLRIVRNGLLIFIAFALWNNVGSLLGFLPNLEKYGFAIFLVCLGYVAARHTFERDQQLNELQKELDIARRIQLSVLPKDFPRSRYFRIAAHYAPMRSVAGDLYDFQVLNEKQAGVLIADVSGHGVPAALIASMVKVASTSHRKESSSPSRFLSALNTTLCGNTQNQFVTAAFAYLDAEEGELRYAAAGHPPMLLLREGQTIKIEENGLMLALFPTAEYTQTSWKLRAGDRMVLYTDGIVEAMDANENEFGTERLSSLVCKTAHLTHAEAANHIMSSVKNWSVSQTDDLTVLVCDYMPGH
ncbi:PP2C family protein-serine/threonine phosphatase [Pseudacidobacterium ailaaui]|uniref:PP2C family protein-serine/threonine phosphatase n=1 Tax=Pseudacidobacterium ailaaui TaxID=1382359 RepID=UPI0005D2C325|nr:PP2C family protein-serine/threonine phosphatase [Pseudacidobacterium ailaaui]